jgi:hypothetical protein
MFLNDPAFTAVTFGGSVSVIVTVPLLFPAPMFITLIAMTPVSPGARFVGYV